MMLAICIVLLILVFLLPFLPGIKELFLQRDVVPLSIRSDYVKNPRYFAESFKQKIQQGLSGDGERIGLRQMKLSKQEMVDAVETMHMVDDTAVPHVCYVRKELSTGNRVSFDKEVFVQEKVKLGAHNRLRALACEGDISLGFGTRVERWVDASGGIEAEGSCNLGTSASCSRELCVAPACSFKRLYGFPVVSGSGADRAEADTVAASELRLIGENGAERNLTEIPPHSRKECSLISSRSLVVGEGTVIGGHIKTHGSLTLESNVAVAGNVFAEGAVHLGQGCRIAGTVFSQDWVYIGPGVTIGQPGKIKSVVGKKGIILEPDSAVYGFLITEGEGKVI